MRHTVRTNNNNNNNNSDRTTQYSFSSRLYVIPRYDIWKPPKCESRQILRILCMKSNDLISNPMVSNGARRVDVRPDPSKTTSSYLLPVRSLTLQVSWGSREGSREFLSYLKDQHINTMSTLHFSPLMSPSRFLRALIWARWSVFMGVWSGKRRSPSFSGMSAFP